jgi:hypothetical protein
MKVLCISKWAKAPSHEERDAILPKEVRATLKLYLDGVIEQMWFKLDAPGATLPSGERCPQATRVAWTVSSSTLTGIVSRSSCDRSDARRVPLYFWVLPTSSPFLPSGNGWAYLPDNSNC